MTSFFAWNTRGFNKTRKQNSVRSWLLNTNPSFGCLLETRVLADNCSNIIQRVFPGWNYITNYDYHRLGRIWLTWSDTISLTPIFIGPQNITAWVTAATGECFVVSCIYASNFNQDRLLLWDELSLIQNQFISSNTPWIVLGDFNQIKTPEDHSRHRDFRGEHLGMREFQQLISDCDLVDLNYGGPRYTWWNQRTSDPIGKKLDHALTNESWKLKFPDSHAKFETNGISDHTRCVVQLSSTTQRRKHHFQFFNFLTESRDFLVTVSQAWSETEQIPHSKYALHSFHRKMKSLKPHIRSLQREKYSDISNRARDAFKMLCDKQELALLHPDTNSFSEVSDAMATWNLWAGVEEKQLQQKSRITWLKNGDRNNSFFHRAVQIRAAKNSIKSLIVTNGEEITDPTRIKQEVAAYYKNLFQAEPREANADLQREWLSLSSYRCPPHTGSMLTSPVTMEEIKKTLFDMPSNKSPGPDGFTSEFFKASWSILGRDFTTAIQSFFIYEHMPRGVNSTKLALLPKHENATTMRDYRPIACCNTLYKVISKILANRLKTLLPDAIEQNQSAFVHGRLLLENVLLATELVKDYHLPKSSARCVLKLDISKAFDTIRWDFIIDTLNTMGIPEKFVSWIRACIQTAAFSVSVNGELDGFFFSERGLRQGCPLSPYLFVITLNVLSLNLTKASTAGRIGYHPWCKKLKLNHLSFADDMMIFMDGNVDSMTETLKVLDEYASISGLCINASKSSVFTTESTSFTLQDLVRSKGIPINKLPIRYLGLPLTTKSMTKDDYEPLIDKIRNRFLSWSSKALSYAGRLQLIQSIIKGITNFWCSVFRLPNRCFQVIDSMCSAFLWSGSPLTTTKTKISWNEVCVPKTEGGLGIRKMRDSSQIYSLNLIWKLLENSGSLWVAWTRLYLLRLNSFWDAKATTTRGSWIWKKLLKLKTLAQGFIKHEIKSGKTTSFWLDNWTGKGRLIDMLGEAGTRKLGIHRDARVSDVVSPLGWCFRRCRDPNICDILEHIEGFTPPNPDAGKDSILWKHGDQDYKSYFSSKKTWHQIRTQKQRVPWYKVVWFKHALPRQAFITWLTVRNRLSTGDRMSNWGQHRACILCGERNETRDHLFFACPYSYTIWNCLGATLLNNMNPDWLTTLNSIIRDRLDTIDKTLIRMTFQSTIYHVWKERNRRYHQHKPQPTGVATCAIRKEIVDRLTTFNEDTTCALRLRWRSLHCP